MSFALYNLPDDCFNCNLIEAASGRPVYSISTDRILLKQQATVVSRPDGQQIARVRHHAWGADEVVIHGASREPFLKKESLLQRKYSFTDQNGQAFVWKRDKVS